MSVMRADVVVIGGGIAGLSTAWYLAEDGVDVTLLEAGDLGAAASGANAGSIHLQIQYPEFVAYGEDWARAYAPSLGFLSASVEMWEGLADRLGEPLDVKLGGGLIVATTDAQMRAIEAKARIEANAGVRTDILTAEELREVAPYLAKDAIGAGFCGREGKANPLRVTPALARAALAAGARIETGRAVTAIAREGAGYVLTTSKGPLRAGRIVIAAGAEAGRVAGLLGATLDIDGFPLQVTVTEPLAPLIPHLIYSAAGKLSLKQAPNGGCIIGGGWPSRVRDGGGLQIAPESLTGNMSVAARVAPVLGQVRALRSWTAWVNGTPDWRPILGPLPGYRDVILALFPWVGFSAGPMTGRVAADLAQGREPAVGLKGVSVLYD